MKNSKILTIAIFCLATCSVFSQNPQIKKADKLYKLQQYAAAIDLYEDGLQESSSLSAKTKLAYCYRMTNRMEAAEKVYSEIVREERARAVTRFYYAEALMANRKYDEAKVWFMKYAELNPNDERGPKMAKACDEIRSLKPVYKKIEIRPFEQNTKMDDSAPVYFKDGIVFTSDRKSGIHPLKQRSGWTGRDFLQIYFCGKEEGGTYEKPVKLSGKLNELNKHCGPVTFDKTFTASVFTRTGAHPGRGNTYNMQLYSAESSDGHKWKKVKLLPFCKKEHNYMHPALSPDGKVLFFVSDKPGGEGGTDIYKSEKTSKGWSRPLNLGINVNTSANEGFPFVSADGKLYFCSKGHTGYGGFDIFMTEQDEKGLWSRPVNIGRPINSSYDDISFHLDENGLEGMLSSNRDGGDDDIYWFDVIEKADESEWRVAEEGVRYDDLISGEPVIAETIVEEGSITNQLKKEIRVDDGLEKPRLPENQLIVETIPDEPQKKETPIVVKTDTPTHAETGESTSFFEEQPGLEVEETEDFEDPVEQMDPPLAEEPFAEPIASMREEIAVDERPNPGTGASELIDSKIDYDVKTPYKGSAVRIIPDETFASKGGGTSTEILDEKKPDLSPATPVKPAGSAIAPEMMYERPAPVVYPLAQMKFLLKKGTPVSGKAFRVNGLEFPKGKYMVTPEGTLQLNRLIDVLKNYPELKIEIAAFTSSIGDDLENLELSRARAGAIMAQLINHGVAKERLSSNGYGEHQLLNHCSNGVNCSSREHQENERVEIRVF